MADSKRADAWSFIPDWKKPEPTPGIKELQRRVNHEVTHLGWKRLEVKTTQDKEWDLLVIMDEF